MNKKNNDKAKKTISKMAEPPKNGVRKVVFLTEVDSKIVLNGPFRTFKEKKIIIVPRYFPLCLQLSILNLTEKSFIFLNKWHHFMSPTSG